MIDTRQDTGTASTPQKYLTEELDWATPLPLELVHRSADTEVFLTSVSQIGQDVFSLGARWPSRHRFFHLDEWGLHDPMAVAEILRQSGIAVAHAGYAVDFGTQFIMVDFSFIVRDRERLNAAAAGRDLVVRLTASDVEHKHGSFRRANLHMEVSARGRAVFAEGQARLLCLPPALYRHLRGRHPMSSPACPAPHAGAGRLPAALVGRTGQADVLLRDAGGATAGSPAGVWTVEADPMHGGQFDHPLDHLPGMVQLEAFRQAALALTAEAGRADPGRFLGCAACFRHIVDLGAEIRCTATASERASIQVALFNGKDPEPATTGVVRLSSLSGGVTMARP
ncbi:MAG TPA: ScbA/BarX family gamma-butyrolactone biosynthesis protein [Actinomycetota bacterium]|nr:ScbA/BarX family gamma-butyrolactone biosynthesis protein [Actinomycetota bacterium]